MFITIKINKHNRETGNVALTQIGIKITIDLI